MESYNQPGADNVKAETQGDGSNGPEGGPRQSFGGRGRGAGGNDNVKVEGQGDGNNGPDGGPRQNFSGRGRGGRGGGAGGGGGGRFGGRGGGGGQNFFSQRGDRNDRSDGDFKGRGGGRGGRGGRPDGFRRQADHPDGMEGRGMDHKMGMGMGGRGPMDKLQEKLNQISGPTFDLPPVDMTEKKFSGRNRLYIGNIGNEVTEDDLTELFKPFGQTAEIFINKEKNFAFIKVDFHSNAEKAKRDLDGHVLKGRNLKIRFAPNSATIKVKNLSPMVTNELLHYAFSIFGEIEKVLVCVDERGKPTGEGIVDFSRKGSAMMAVRKCSEGCFFLTASLQPVIVETHEIVDDIDGYSDKNINRKNMEFNKEREQGPRFANPGSFEHEYGTRWKAMYELHQQKEEALKKELQLEKDKLEAQMEYARYEHETEVLREQLRAREMDKERQKREWEMKQRQAEDERLRTEEQMRRQQEELEARMLAQQEEMRRRQQENNLFMQAHNLDSLLDQQEQAYDPPYTNTEFSSSTTDVVDPVTFMSSYEHHGGRYEGRDSGARGSLRGRWVNDNRRNDDYPNKRRRF